MPSGQPIGEFLAALGARTPTPASGAAAALTAAMAAALAELAGRFAGDEEAVAGARALVARLEQLADEDVAAYGAFMASRSEEAGAIADRLAAALRTSVSGDAEAAASLARAAAVVARRLAELNRGQ